MMKLNRLLISVSVCKVAARPEFVLALESAVKVATEKEYFDRGFEMPDPIQKCMQAHKKGLLL